MALSCGLNGSTGEEIIAQINKNSDDILLKEDYLDVPDIDGKVLTSDTSGNRSWITPPSGVTDHQLLNNRDANDAHPVSSITGLQTELDNKINQGEALSISGGVLTGSLYIGQNLDDLSTYYTFEINKPDNTTNVKFTQFETTTYVTGNVKYNSLNEEIPLNETYPYIFRYGMNISGTTNRGFRVQYSNAVADTPTDYTTLFQVNDSVVNILPTLHTFNYIKAYSGHDFIKGDDSLYIIRFRDLNDTLNRSRIYRTNASGIGDLGIQNYDNNANSIGHLILESDGSLTYNGTELAPKGEIITYFINLNAGITSLPKGFVLCDGNNDTPDMTSDFKTYSNGELVYLMRVLSIEDGPDETD